MTFRGEPLLANLRTRSKFRRSFKREISTQVGRRSLSADVFTRLVTASLCGRRPRPGEVDAPEVDAPKAGRVICRRPSGAAAARDARAGQGISRLTRELRGVLYFQSGHKVSRRR